MTNNNATVFNCSLKKYNQLLRVYGTGSLTELTLLKLIYKYACYSPTESTLQRLDQIISQLQQGTPTICMDVLTGSFFPQGEGEDSNVVDVPVVGGNNAPTVQDLTINLDDDGGITYASKTDTSPLQLLYTFTRANFTTGFNDIDSDGPGAIILSSLPLQGDLYYNSSLYVTGTVILDPTKLEYWMNYDDAVAINSSFEFRISDDNVDNPLYSNSATITLTKSAVGGQNQSATIGDNLVYADNFATTVLIPSMFTDGNPAYSDPENDPLESIRIDRISGQNQGQFLYNGVAVTDGQVISAIELSAGNFVHIGANVDTLSSDIISFSVRDSGSLIWVS